jgi:hypothetical protein
MNEVNKNPYENYEIIARALEIAITLTKADDTWIKLEGSKDVVMDDKLLKTVRAVARILTDTTLLAISGGRTAVISGYIRKADKPNM